LVDGTLHQLTDRVVFVDFSAVHRSWDWYHKLHALKLPAANTSKITTEMLSLLIKPTKKYW